MIDSQYIENNFPLQDDINLLSNSITKNNNNNNNNYNNSTASFNLNYENPFLRNRKSKNQQNIYHQHSTEHTPITHSNENNIKLNKYKFKPFAGDPTDKTLLENHGMRVRYEDYTTIGMF